MPTTPETQGDESPAPDPSQITSGLDGSASPARVGNLTADLDLRVSPTGTVYARGRLAVQTPTTPGDWKSEKVTIYYDLTCFGAVAEHAADTLRKGMRVIAVGRTEVQRWSDSDGQPRETVRIICEELSPSLRWAQVSVKPLRRSGRR